MTVILETMREFKTAHFTIKICAVPDDEFDPSEFVCAEELKADLESGKIVAFCGAVLIYLRENLIGSDFISGCCYESYKAFLTSGYVREMLSHASREARDYLENLPTLRSPKQK